MRRSCSREQTMKKKIQTEFLYRDPFRVGVEGGGHGMPKPTAEYFLRGVTALIQLDICDRWCSGYS